MREPSSGTAARPNQALGTVWAVAPRG